jgi:hypothetical protein
VFLGDTMTLSQLDHLGEGIIGGQERDTRRIEGPRHLLHTIPIIHSTFIGA